MAKYLLEPASADEAPEGKLLTPVISHYLKKVCDGDPALRIRLPFASRIRCHDDAVQHVLRKPFIYCICRMVTRQRRRRSSTRVCGSSSGAGEVSSYRCAFSPARSTNVIAQARQQAAGAQVAIATCAAAANASPRNAATQHVLQPARATVAKKEGTSACRKRDLVSPVRHKPPNRHMRLSQTHAQHQKNGPPQPANEVMNSVRRR